MAMCSSTIEEKGFRNIEAKSTPAENSKAKTLNWNETKQFRDPVYGYIQVPAPYVRYIIDTSYMQRIKGVAQSGLRPLFAAATHDRFAHSVGVFRFAMLLYDSFQKSAEEELDKLVNLDRCSKKEAQRLKKKLIEWKNLLAIASLLHDIGHPIQSHSMEFLYDDVFLKFPEDEPEPGFVQKFDHDEWGRAKRQYDAIRECQISYNESPFKKAMRKKKEQINSILGECERYKLAAVDKNYKGNQHERMSAYYILTDSTLKKTFIRCVCLSIKNLLSVRLMAARMKPYAAALCIKRTRWILSAA